MRNEREFMKCEICGNIVGVIKDAGGKLVCCEKEMLQLIPNTTEASEEKHLPVIEKNGMELKVTVGSVDHPMTEEHHIAWIAVAQGDMTQRKPLDVTGAPVALFCITDEPITVYSYCNLHGLWGADF